MAVAADAAATRSIAAPLLIRPTVSGLAERLARALPPDARLRQLAVEADGTIGMQIDSDDPDALRAALRGEPLLGSLRMTGQEPADNGVRVTLRSRAR